MRSGDHAAATPTSNETTPRLELKTTTRPNPHRLRKVLDYGLLPEEIAELDAINPKCSAEIAALIVNEADMARLGRWGGNPAPKRWIAHAAWR